MSTISTTTYAARRRAPTMTELVSAETARLAGQARRVRLFRVVYRMHAAYLFTVLGALAVTVTVAVTSHTLELAPTAAGLCAAWLAGLATLAGAAAADLHLNK